MTEANEETKTLANAEGSSVYAFGPFVLDATQQALWRNGEVVPLTPKAFQTLLFLVRNSGRLIEKDELLKSVWPDSFVEEATLAQNVFTLRKVLRTSASSAEEYIKTIPKRGYRFMAPVTDVKKEDATLQAEGLTAPPQGYTLDRRIDSLAVIPIMNTTDDSSVEYLCDGLTETIVNSLSLFPDLQVKACSTVLRYKGRQVNPQQAGRELEVGAVLIGKILTVSEMLIVRVELVEVTNGWQLWGEEYHRSFADIFSVQEEIATHVAHQLRLNLGKFKSKHLLKLRPDNVEAYKLYLKGRYFLNKRITASYAQAIEAFKQAIEVDPDYALAYCGLADSYVLYDFYGLAPPWRTIPKARAAALKAVDLDDELAEAHTSLGSVRLVYDRDPAISERAFRRAIELNPKYARAHDGLAQCLIEMERYEESLAECRLALELEPYDLEINQHLSWYSLLTRQYDQAIEQLKKTLEMGPDFYRARLLLGIAYEQQGLFSEAIKEFHRAGELEDTAVLSGFLGYAYARAGRKQEAIDLLSAKLEQAKQSYVPPYSIALIYTGMGQLEEAFLWLERACIEHSRWRGWFKLTPELDSLQSDERFRPLFLHESHAR